MSNSGPRGRGVSSASQLPAQDPHRPGLVVAEPSEERSLAHSGLAADEHEPSLRVLPNAAQQRGERRQMVRPLQQLPAPSVPGDRCRHVVVQRSHSGGASCPWHRVRAGNEAVELARDPTQTPDVTAVERERRNRAGLEAHSRRPDLWTPATRSTRSNSTALVREHQPRGHRRTRARHQVNPPLIASCGPVWTTIPPNVRENKEPPARAQVPSTSKACAMDELRACGRPLGSLVLCLGEAAA